MSSTPIPTCPDCGLPHVTRHGHQACTGHAKHTARPEKRRPDGKPTPCTRPPLAGLNVCGAHGGRSPQAKVIGQRRVEAQAAEQAVRTLGLPIDITPTEALLEEVRWTAGHVAWLRDKVQELGDRPFDPADDEADPHPLVWGTTKVKSGGDDSGTTNEAKPSIWYELYHRERQHLVAVSMAALKAGVEERRVRLAEQQGQIAVELIRRILDALYAALVASGISEDLLLQAWEAAVADVVPREIRAMDALTRGNV